jgi:hypothetical protein
VIPLAIAVLLVIGMGAVAMGDMRKLSGSPSPVGTSNAAVATTPGSASSSDSSSSPGDSAGDPLAPGAAQAAVNAVDQLNDGAQFGVGVLDRDSGQETLGNEGTTQFYSASVLKLFLITDLFHQQESGAITLSSGDLGNIHLALTQSDDNAMDALWESYDGPQAIAQLTALAHLQDTDVPDDINETGEWGETLISARDVLAVYQYMLTSLNTADRQLILTDLNNAAPDGSDGFDQSFGLLGSTRNGDTKAKQGWMEFNDQVMLHTTGIVDSGDDVVVALLSEQSGSGSDADYAAGRQDVDQATAVLLKALGPDATD